MTKVKIVGSGSIGNHMAYACRQMDWEVTLVDIDKDALKRTKDDIYPTRYGKWDETIKLHLSEEVAGETFDVVIIGTPPNSHIPLAMAELESNPPKVMLVEKPLCEPSMEGLDKLNALASEKNCKICVSYNHTTTENTLFTQKLIKDGLIGDVETINVQWLEHWGGIFNAHPWLAGPHDSYLGDFNKGGGSTGEHSHCLNIWQHFARFCGKGEVTDVNAMMDIVKTDRGENYDKVAVIGLRTEGGLVGNVITDVVTAPAKKALRIQGTKGFIEWSVNHKPGFDAVIYAGENGEVTENLIEKTRPDDFQNEIKHVQEILNNEETFKSSPISLTTGMNTMLVIAASYESNRLGKAVKIDYSVGCNHSAIS